MTLAKAKGLDKNTLIMKHALRNALIPVITILAPILVNLMTVSYTHLTLFYGVFLIIATLIVYILYGVIDPRVNIADSKE